MKQEAVDESTNKTETGNQYQTIPKAKEK